MGNMVIMSDALDVIKPAVLELLTEQQSNGNRRLKRAFRLQSAAFMAALMTGTWPLFQEPTIAKIVPVSYCESGKHFYVVGTLAKRSNGTYRECFLDRPGARPYWGTESRPRSRVPRLT
jgi:hypothetical protein